MGIEDIAARFTGFPGNCQGIARVADKWSGVICGVFPRPHLSPGNHGHGGACGPQAWIDPAKAAYVIMVQRANFPNSDASDVRREFQKVAAAAFAK